MQRHLPLRQGLHGVSHFKTVKFTGFPFAPIVFSRDSRTAYVANDAWSGTVIPLRTRTGRLGPPIRVGHDPVAMAPHSSAHRHRQTRPGHPSPRIHRDLRHRAIDGAM
jgi:hypothetical protein